MTERLVIGIDLGTTNSLAAIRAGQGARVLRDAQGNALIPSVVCFAEDGSTKVGSEARALRLVHPDRTVFSIKRLIGRAGEEVDREAGLLPYPVRRGERDLARVHIDERDYSPEEISALILRELKQTAEAALGQDVEAAVITVPAWFDDGQRQATKDAAALAGLQCLRIINEPTAASLAYGIDGSKDGTILVYDLGGGTFDVSILRIHEGVFRVLSTAGDTHLGGDDFDQLLCDRILAAAKAEPSDEATQDPFVLQAIRAAAEAIKIRLSSEPQATLQIDLGAHGTIDFSLSRDEFEQMITPLIDRTLTCCQRALRDAELEPDAIDEVVLVGGSTRIPAVRARLQELCNKPPQTGVDPETAIALGAAIQADVLAGNERSLLLLDVIPLSLGIETLGGAMQKLIMRNSTIPTSATEEFSTAVDGQSAVVLNIYQGERELVQDCRALGSFTLRGLPALPAGLPRIEVSFLVDADGVLRVTAVEQRTGTEASIQVVPSHGLTRDEVNRMMHDSIEHAEADYIAREVVDLANKAQAMVAGTKKALALSDLPPDQTYSVNKAVRQLEKLLAAEPAAADLKAATEELSKLTATIADDVISSAVKQALVDEQSKEAPSN